MHTVFPQRNSREGDYCSLLGTCFTEGEYLNLLNFERLQNEDERIRFPSLTSWPEPNSAQILDLTNRYPRCPSGYGRKGCRSGRYPWRSAEHEYHQRIRPVQRAPPPVRRFLTTARGALKRNTLTAGGEQGGCNETRHPYRKRNAGCHRSLAAKENLRTRLRAAAENFVTR